ncbi:MAG TPA: MFS transporter, partial [Bryobacteraceae bacterium]|nr:MFS transporter [Bryobacteraceae bacterium]
WFRTADRAKAVAMFMIAIPMSEIIGAPVSALLMQLDFLGLAGWRWLLILEGLPAVVLGIVTLFYLTDRPGDAAWLTKEQREWLTGTLASEGRERHSLKVWQALTDKRVLLLMFAYFAMLNLGYAIIMWLPKILQASFGRSNSTTILLTAVPFLIGAPLALVVAWHSDKTGERRWHAAGPLLAGSASLALFPWAQSSVFFALPLFAMAVIGGQSARAPFWTIATTLLSGRAAAASVGLINSFGNLGGFVGPYTVGWLATHTSGFEAGVLYMVFSAAASAGLILLAGRSAIRQQLHVVEMRNRVEGVQGKAIP